MDSLKYILNLAIFVPERLLAIEKPYFFVLLLAFWLLLVFFTLKRQIDFFRKRRQILNIKKLQFETRKKLKLEQLTFDKVRCILHASMEQIEHSQDNKLAELEELHGLLQDINDQLRRLEGMLNFD